MALLAVVSGHEGRIEVFGSRMRQFVDHPGLGHELILPARVTRFPVVSRSTDTV